MNLIWSKLSEQNSFIEPLFGAKLCTMSSKWCYFILISVCIIRSAKAFKNHKNAHWGRSVDMQKNLLTRLPPPAKIMVKIRTSSADNLELDSTTCNCNCTLYFERKTKNIAGNFKVTFSDSIRVFFFFANSGSVSLFSPPFLRFLNLLSEGFNKKTLNIYNVAAQGIALRCPCTCSN